jgi:LPPG:FO 2-phospho-L-lactate transferase
MSAAPAKAAAQPAAGGVTVLSGGIGGAKLVLGLYSLLPQDQLTVIANNGDDLTLFGLRICPDTDTLLYSLSDEVHPDQGWGVAADTFRALKRVKELGGPAWFNLGDIDLGLHLYRTEMLRQGIGLTEITRRLAQALGVVCRILPMCEHFVGTRLETNEGRLDLQDYLVRRRAAPEVKRIFFDGAAEAFPGPGVLEAIGKSRMIVIAPSNPFISIAPILAVPGMREALKASTALRVAVTPLVGGKALKGPTDKMMVEMGMKVSPVTVAESYRGFLDVFVLDSVDAALRPEVEALGIRCVVAPTVMKDLPAKQALARAVLGLGERSRAAR